MVLLEKLNKLETSLVEQGLVLGRIQEATSLIEPNFPHQSKIQSPFCPAKPRNCGEVFQVPKGRWPSLDYFMSLPFVGALLPSGYKYESLMCDNNDCNLRNSKLPNLHPDHVQGLIEVFLNRVHPLHPVMEIATIEQYKKEIDEEGLSWNGETAIILLMLAIASILTGGDARQYHGTAKRRMGYALEEVNVMSIQAHYLQG
jgi:hypothetical protein